MAFFERKKMRSSTDDASTSSKPAEIAAQIHRGKNVFQLLAQREINPRSKHSSKRLWVGDTRNYDEFGLNCEFIDAKHGLASWAEAESLKHISAKYCPLVPPPRSTIAAAFSPDGKTLASTHGDHTVKIIDCQSGNCLKVLSGHRRTPWVVRFHPVNPKVLASGSLDHEVRLWDASTAECLGSRNFSRPIASIAFHADGELLAVASGHKLHIWRYDKRGEGCQPVIVLKTRRSLRAVHFHPNAAPLLLTAEVSDLDSSDSPMSLATSLEDGRTSSQYGNGSFGFINLQQMFDSSASLQPQIDVNTGTVDDYLVAPMDESPMIPSSSYNAPEDSSSNNFLSEMESAVPDSDAMELETTEGQPIGNAHQNNSPVLDLSHGRNVARTSTGQSRENLEVTPGIYLSNLAALQMLSQSGEVAQMHQFFPFGDSRFWELPFLQGWLMGQSQAGLHPMLSLNGALHENSAGFPRSIASYNLAPNLATRNVDPSVLTDVNHPRIGGRSSLHNRSLGSRAGALSGSGEGAPFINIRSNEIGPQPAVARTETALATSLAAAVAAAELPCTVKLKIWAHDIKDPCAVLDAGKCRLIIPHVVLCSEMGAHFSPCGRFLAACVACRLPHMESGLQSHVNHESGASTSPTRHPISAHQVMYELRIYSLEEATFGQVLASCAIRAAHCLTSIQFSPTSDHMLLAYGRRHGSLLRSLVIDAETTMPIYTILEVYRVSDMKLVRLLPSAEDEVNVACFHPLVGGGLVYGTKEGKLRILQCDSSSGTDCTGPNFLLEENMLEVPTHTL
ncbi:uncharacterized protein LOC113348003 [Papaver somniferum]|nr:uncharacterized protein LOC113348003 [Papaver somniferum]